MELIFLGHASWLVRIGELSILFDPLLAGSERGGVHEVFPPRRVHAGELRPDFIVVSHAHPDHFDVQSLALLAELDADSVVLTASALVERSARRLGFRSVRRLASFDRVELSSGALLTTPSHGDEEEWGMVLVHDGACVFNQIDSVAGGAARVREMLEQCARALGLGEPRLSIDLGLVRFQPLLEIDAQIGGPTGFPLRAYAELLDEVAALGARAIVPSAGGQRHTDAHGQMNGIVYPVSEARFVRDVALRAPATRALASRIGGRYRAFAGGAEDVGDAPELVTPIDADDDRVFRPFELGPIEDPEREPDAAMWPGIETWVRRTLAAALVDAYPGMLADRPLSFVLELIGYDRREHFTLRVESGKCAIERRPFAEHDAWVAIATSELWRVIEGKTSWAEPLLAGLLRTATRTYRVDEHGVHGLNVGVPFLYYALGYDQSVERAVETLLSASDSCRAGSRP